MHVYLEDGAKGHEYQGDPHQLLHGELVDPNQNYLLDDHRDPHLDEMFRSTLWYLR